MLWLTHIHELCVTTLLRRQQLNLKYKVYSFCNISWLHFPSSWAFPEIIIQYPRDTRSPQSKSSQAPTLRGFQADPSTSHARVSNERLTPNLERSTTRQRFKANLQPPCQRDSRVSIERLTPNLKRKCREHLSPMGKVTFLSIGQRDRHVYPTGNNVYKKTLLQQPRALH